MKKLLLVFLGIIFWGSNYLAAAGIKDKLGIGVYVNSQRLYGDSYTGTFQYGVNPISIRFNFKPTLFFDMELGYSKASVNNGFATLSTDMLNVGFKFGYRFFNYKRLNPLFYVGLGTISYEPAGSRVYDGYGAVGAGAEFFINRYLGLNLNGDYRLTSGDDFDGADLGSSKDAFLNIAFGLNYYLGGRRTQFDEMEDNLPEGYSAVEQTPSLDAPSENVKVSNEDYAMLTFKKNQLINSIAQKEKDIKLLRAKVNTLNAQSTELTEKLQLAGLTGAENSPESEPESTYLIYYQNALVLFQAEYYENALAIFKSLLNDDPSNTLTANCWYWIGECHFNLQDFQSAVAAFKRATALQNNTQKAEMAELMMGLSHLKLGDETAARINFEKLLNTNMNNSFTELAKEYLSELSLN